jgi:H/ACA ribonucleoprotein complex subunit 3
MDVYLNQKKIRLSPKQAIGKGGEADVFDIGNQTALKLFKPPSHPDYQGLLQEQQAARDRLTLHQQKLRQFPAHLPSRVVAPIDLAMDKAGKTVLGYTMPLLQGTDVLLRYSDRSFRQAGIGQQLMVQIFQNLHDTVSKLHFADVVIGDFNDLNVLVRETDAYLIDADSFQFGVFPCQVFTARFVDPRLCAPQATQPLLQQPHNANSDWYAFAVMLMQCLLFVDPYGGVYKPKTASQQVPHAARSLHRITVFHPDVRYPKPAIPYKVLPDELLHYFHQVFEHDLRGQFPRSLLDNLRWTICTHCGLEHARPVCPNCTGAPDTGTQGHGAIGTLVRGTVTASRLFSTEGVILCTTVEQGQLKWVYHDRGKFYREDGSVVLVGTLNPHLRWRIQGKTTLLGYQGQVIRFQPDQPPERFAVDSYGAMATFDTNASHCYWIHDGQLLKHTATSSCLTPQSSPIGNVLPGQTRFWVGSHFGFGFYQAGDLKVAFVFDAERPGLNDRVQLPRWQGQLIAVDCTFSATYCWLFLSTQAQGHLYYDCIVIDAQGQIVAIAQTRADEPHWLAGLGNGGAIVKASGCAAGEFLLAATDEGIIRVEIRNSQLVHTCTFSDSEPFVNFNTQLLPDTLGLYIVRPQEIQRLRLG